jgi:carbonic anhydrase
MLPFLLVATLGFPQEHAHAKPASAKAASDNPGNPETALAELRAGNARFGAGKRTRTLETAKDPALREQLAKGQAPFAVIVTCADSRVPDALLFDQEMGRLFVVREAGNAPDLQGIASVDYAVEHLGSKVVVVMGHSACGAVKAVMESNGKALPGNLWAFQGAMAGLLETTQHDPNEDPKVHLAHLVEANAVRQAQALVDRSEAVRKLVSAGKLSVVPAVYDLASGKVQFLAPVRAAEAPAHH